MQWESPRARECYQAVARVLPGLTLRLGRTCHKVTFFLLCCLTWPEEDASLSSFESQETVGWKVNTAITGLL